MPATIPILIQLSAAECNEFILPHLCIINLRQFCTTTKLATSSWPTGAMQQICLAAGTECLMTKDEAIRANFSLLLLHIGV